MQNRVATRKDFNALSYEQQGKFSELISFCRSHSLSLRCEMVGGTDFTVVVGPGLPLAAHWQDRLDLD